MCGRCVRSCNLCDSILCPRCSKYYNWCKICDMIPCFKCVNILKKLNYAEFTCCDLCIKYITRFKINALKRYIKMYVFKCKVSLKIALTNSKKYRIKRMIFIL